MNLIHLRNAITVVEAGAVFFPPTPAFYNNPLTIDDIVHHTVGRVLDQFNINIDNIKRWKVDEYEKRGVVNE
jgi:4-hydroxy-3-polyprenylbenzoate decarboxylase